MLAHHTAQDYGIEAQREGESDSAFKHRVSGALRAAGHIIEAHEALQDKFFDESPDVMTGITGAVAQAMQGKDYHLDGEQQVGMDIAAGVVSQALKKDNSALLLLAMMLGGGRD